MQDSQQLLLRHGDKLVAGSFAAWLVYSLAMPFVARPSALGERENLAQGLQAIETHEQNFEVTAEPPTRLLPVVQHELDPTAVPAAEAFGPWLQHRRPSFAYDITRPPPLPVPVHVAPVSFRSTKVEHHRTTLAWARDEQNRYVKILGFDVLRQDAPGAAFVPIGSVEADRTEFVDANAPAFATVVYRLEERASLDTDDPSLPKNMPALDPSLAVTSIVSAPVSTPRDFYVAVEDGAAADPLAAGGIAAQSHATLRVYSWQPNGKFATKTFRNVEVDKPIGTCGAILKDVKVEKRALNGSKVAIMRAVAKIEWPNGVSEELVWGETPDLK